MFLSDDLLQGLIEAAIAAGREVLDVYASDFAIDIKSDASPVTAADRRAEEVILARLAELMPGVAVVAEEAAAAGHLPGDLGERFFLVDPLDGTKEFCSRNGEFTVNIGLIEGDRPAAGVVFAPVIGRVYAGVVGVGAGVGEVVDGQIVSWAEARVRPAPHSGLTVLASRSHCGPDTEAFLAKLDVAERVSAGSSLKFCRVAEGLADLYPRLGPTMEWDTAAGDAVLRAAGGKVVTLDGALLAYGKRGTGQADFRNPWFLAVGQLPADAHEFAAAAAGE
ncbi:MAG: 3'(2'),5'-bisphosphate nucleotidase CysQ [Ancalomicrobiaceae bacterium]|nr:3'(2'),5'-bisphosphate nucleotidase CysQ [Ancalomicrobiaceae bacterium]